MDHGLLGTVAVSVKYLWRHVIAPQTSSDWSLLTPEGEHSKAKGFLGLDEHQICGSNCGTTIATASTRHRLLRDRNQSSVEHAPLLAEIQNDVNLERSMVRANAGTAPGGCRAMNPRKNGAPSPVASRSIGTADAPSHG